MRLWLSVFLLGPALMAQTQGADTLQQLQQKLDGLTPAPARQGNFRHLPAMKAPKVRVGNPARPLRIKKFEFKTKPVEIAKVQRKACSVPLVNALKPQPKMTIALAPWVKEHFHAEDYVTMPAPPCDDSKQ
jgi:hypothetical protein